MQKYPEPEKQCCLCHRWLSYSSFSVDRMHPDGLNYRCRACNSKYRKKSYTRLVMRRQLLSKYNITVQQYDRMLVEQNGVCAICKMPEKQLSPMGSIKPLAVDHDHSTGDVRALLCAACNSSLGRMGEDPNRIRALLHYAEWCQIRESHKIIQLSMMESDCDCNS